MAKLFIIAAILLLFISCAEKQESHNNKLIKKDCYYNHIDSFDYRYILISCDAPVVYDALLDRLECLDKKYDMKYFRNNYLSDKEEMDNRNRIIHFVAFGYFHDTIMKSELGRYILDQDTASRAIIIGDNGFPYYYAKKRTMR